METRNSDSVPAGILSRPGATSAITVAGLNSPAKPSVDGAASNTKESGTLASPPSKPSTALPAGQTQGGQHADAQQPFAPKFAKRVRTAGLPILPRTKRSSRFMRLSDLLKLANAVGYAQQRSTPMTAFLTVYWKNHPDWESSPKSWTELDQRLLRAMTSYLDRQGVEPVWAYVRENRRARGPHTHYLLHLPNQRWASLSEGLKGYLVGVLGFQSCIARRHPAPIRITGGGWRGSGMSSPKQVKGLVKYLGKALDPTEALGHERLVDFLGIEPKPHATVECRRVSSSDNIGPSARKNARWDEMLDAYGLRSFLGDASTYRPPAPRVPARTSRPRKAA